MNGITARRCSLGAQFTGRFIRQSITLHYQAEHFIPIPGVLFSEQFFTCTGNFFQNIP
mgnify:CR=1 FL=1